MIEVYTTLLINLLNALGLSYQSYTIIIIGLWYTIPIMIISTIIQVSINKIKGGSQR